MTPLSSTKENGRRRPVLWSWRAMAAAALILFGSQILAGYLFLWSIGVEPRHATPLTIARYFYHYGSEPTIRSRLGTCVAVGMGVAIAGASAALWPRSRSLHGDARFARRAEIAAAGLLGDRGILLGEIRGRYLMLPGQQGVAVAAPPRSGKGTGIVIPNLLNWPGSLVCVDIKRENWTITSGYRASRGQECFLFDPLSEEGKTFRWNPLTYVSSNPATRINDLQRIGSMLYPDVPGTDPFWVASARSLFLGIALYLFETPHLPKTVGEILRQGMASDDEGFGAHWKRIVQGRNSGRHPLSPECVRALYDVIDLAPVTASSIRKTFTSRLDLWLNPMLDQATATSDFDLRDLRRRPISIYVAVNPDDLHRLRPVLGLFFEQAIGLQTRVLPEHDPSLKLQVMAMLDECPALGRIPVLAESIVYVPGYGLRIVMVFHAPSQFREVYGPENARTMLKSLGARIVYAPKDYDDAKEISDELGNTTVRAHSRSRPQFGSWGQSGSRGTQINTSEHQRALLLPQEVKELGGQEEIVFCEGLRPIRATKIRYWSDRRFRERLLPPPEVAPLEPISIDRRRSSASDGEDNLSAAEDGNPMQHVQVSSAMPAAEVANRLGDLSLADFNCDFSQVEIPEHDGPWSEAEMQTAVNSFMATIEGR